MDQRKSLATTYKGNFVSTQSTTDTKYEEIKALQQISAINN
uniref:Uncharacterized protein n=1 Tax=Nelumbo nucifera TaxID=4432 RepID=A0A822Y6L0_NELNU|nr:TPA_asm: hypothetical protein HUJ06_029131 [Nelumbo nucifera]